uniref:Uncharacterized protein n=1 Tax=viral metagenome TaxID=1070528 RepID=A0A2V0RC09_9ZZZZ
MSHKLNSIKFSLIERAFRPGFRAAIPGYVLRSLYSVSSGELTSVRDDAGGKTVDTIKVSDFADRLGISVTLLRNELAQIVTALSQNVFPGEIMRPTEFDMHKGAFDLQSLICYKLSLNDVGSSDVYDSLLSHILSRFDHEVKYTNPAKIERISDRFIQIMEDGAPILHYMNTPNDTMNRLGVGPSDFMTKFKIISGFKAIVINASSTSENGKIHIALNLNDRHEQFQDVVEILQNADYAMDGNGTVYPFVIESVNLENGTLIIHLFSEYQGKPALTRWMEHCDVSFHRVMISILSTLWNNSEAYYASGLGGQFPKSFFRILHGTYFMYNETIHLDSDNDANRITRDDDPKQTLRAIMLDYSKAHATGILNDATRKAFGVTKGKEVTSADLNGIRLFIKHFFTFLMRFSAFIDIKNFNLPDKEIIKSGGSMFVLDMKRRERATNHIINHNIDPQFFNKNCENKAEAIVRRLESRIQDDVVNEMRHASAMIKKVETFL